MKCSSPASHTSRLWAAETLAPLPWSSVPLLLCWFCCHARRHSRISPIRKCYCSIFGGKTLKFLLIVMFSFIIVFMTQDQGLRARTMLPCWGCDLSSLLFCIPDSTDVYLVGKLCSLGDQNLLICNCRW